MGILPDMSQRQGLRPFWTIIREGARRRRCPVVFQSKKFNLPPFTSLGEDGVTGVWRAIFEFRCDRNVRKYRASGVSRTSRRTGTKRPSSSNSSSKYVLSSSGVPWHAKIPASKFMREGRLCSTRLCSEVKALRANLPAGERLASANSSIHRSWFPRTVGRASDWRASKVSFGHNGLVTQSPRLTVRSTPRPLMSASTASKAGRFPCTSEMIPIRIARFRSMPVIHGFSSRFGFQMLNAIREARRACSQ